MTSPSIVPLYDAAAIAARVRELGALLERDREFADPLVVALLGGSVVFLADLIRTISTPVRFEFIHVQYEPGDSEEAMRIHYPIPVEVAGQRILVLKDVVSSGVIETYLGNELRLHGAKEVRFAALIDVPSERKTGFVLDHALFTVERSGIFVGYGLKHLGRHGNLPYVGQIET
jgi:hypoxanthine phosphoribosyltransferase